MSIRIPCEVAGYEDFWIEFRDEPWPFGDRRKILASTNDEKVLELILPYAEAWNLKDVEGRPLPFSRDILALDSVDDLRIIPWFVAAWFRARAERSALPKVP